MKLSEQDDYIDSRSAGSWSLGSVLAWLGPTSPEPSDPSVDATAMETGHLSSRVASPSSTSASSASAATATSTSPWYKRALTSPPPFLVYGAFMSVAAVVAVIAYVLYMTFDYHVTALLVVVAATALLSALRWSLRVAAAIGFVAFFLGGMGVAYLHLRSFASLDATIRVDRGTAIDPRWTTEETGSWFGFNGMPELQSIIVEMNMDGKTVISTPTSRFRLRPFNIDNEGHLLAISRATALGRALEKARQSHTPCAGASLWSKESDHIAIASDSASTSASASSADLAPADGNMPSLPSPQDPSSPLLRGPAPPPTPRLAQSHPPSTSTSTSHPLS